MEQYLIFGGVYGNLQALEAALQWATARKISASNIFCTGDLVAYCAEPNETVTLLRQAGVRSIQGNVEESLSENSVDCGCGFVEGSVCDRLSVGWFSYLRENLSQENREYLKNLPKILELNLGGSQAKIVHGSFREISRYVFPSTDATLKCDEFRASRARILLAGHCGIPFIQKIDDRVWANSGALGMPANDGTARVWMLHIQVDQKKIVFQSVPLEYDANVARSRMLERGLPKEYADTLLSGIWPSCEILPAHEARNQGLALEPESLTIVNHR